MEWDQLCPPGFFEFERNKSIRRYEDQYVIMERAPDGIVTMTGKPLAPVFIYPKESSDAGL